MTNAELHAAAITYRVASGDIEGARAIADTDPDAFAEMMRAEEERNESGESQSSKPDSDATAAE